MLPRLYAVTMVLLLSVASASAMDPGDISAIQEKAKKDAASMAIPQNDYQAIGQGRAEEAYRYYQSEEFQNKLAAERERVRKEVFGREEYYKDGKKGGGTGGLGAERAHLHLPLVVRTQRDLEAVHQRGGRPS